MPNKYLSSTSASTYKPTLCAQILPVHVHKQDCEDIVMTPWQLFSFTVTPGGQSLLTQGAQQYLQPSGLAGISLPAYTFQHFTYSNQPRHISMPQMQLGSALRTCHIYPLFFYSNVSQSRPLPRRCPPRPLPCPSGKSV